MTNWVGILLVNIYDFMNQSISHLNNNNNGRPWAVLNNFLN